MTTDVHRQDGGGDYACAKDKWNFGLLWLTLRLCGSEESVTPNTKVILQNSVCVNYILNISVVLSCLDIRSVSVWPDVVCCSFFMPRNG